MIAISYASSSGNVAQEPPPPSLRMSPAPPKPAPGLRVRLTPAGPALWSVEDAAGRIIGHLQSIEHPLGTRWRTRRHHVRAGGFLTLGEFWAIDDAVAALRMN